MRPKRRILLISASEEFISLRRMLFETRGYAVCVTGDFDEAVAFVKQTRIDLAIIGKTGASLDACNALMRRIKETDNLTNIILTSDTVKPGSIDHQADLFLGKDVKPWELLDDARRLAARKRGPKPVKKVVSQQLAG